MTLGHNGAAPNYFPNSVPGTPLPNASYADAAWKLGETIVDRFDSTQDHDDFSQAGDLYRLFDGSHRERLATRIAASLGHARMEVQVRQLCHFFRADEDFGRRIAVQLRIDVTKFMKNAEESRVELTAR
jgi:catalase